MPSLRYRRVDHALRDSRGGIVTEVFNPPMSEAASAQGSRRSTLSWSHKGSCVSGPGSSGSVITMCTVQNVLEHDPLAVGGGFRPGVSSRLLSRGKCPVVIDAAASVALAPNSACRAMQTFVPRWKGEVNARERYSKTLSIRHDEGSLRILTALARRQDQPGQNHWFERRCGQQ